MTPQPRPQKTSTSTTRTRVRRLDDSGVEEAEQEHRAAVKAAEEAADEAIRAGSFRQRSDRVRRKK